MEERGMQVSIFKCAAVVLSILLILMLLNGCLTENETQPPISSLTNSPYEIQVTLPDCDSGNPQVQLIRTNADWGAINDGSKSIFCVLPGDYTSMGSIKLTASGTSSAKRYIRYFNPDSPNDATHPVRMNGGLATVKQLVFEGADWVVIDRLHVKEPGQTRGNLVRFNPSSASTDNTLNRLLVEGGGDGGGQISFNGTGGSDRNTLQLSVVRNTLVSPGSDNHCVLLTGDAKNTRVISNEIYNCAADVLQIHPGVYNGTIIANNDMYSESSFVQHTENGIDLKGGGSIGPGNWVTIEGNRFFGLGGSGGTGGSIGAIDFSNDTGVKSYILFKNNVFYNNPLPWTTNTGDGAGSSHHLSLVGNIIYNARIAAMEPIKNTHSIEIYYNTIVNVASGSKWLSGSPASQDVMCNVIIGGQGADSPTIGTTADYNSYYGTPGVLRKPGKFDKFADSTAASGNKEYAFSYKLLTGPLTYTIPAALTSSASSHKNMCSGASAGSRTGMGVDDAILSQTAAGAARP
jgi:hypothetical protein